MKVRARYFDSIRAETVADDGMRYRELPRQVPHPLYSGFTLCEGPCDTIAACRGVGHRMLTSAVGVKEMRVGRGVKDGGGLT